LRSISRYKTTSQRNVQISRNCLWPDNAFSLWIYPAITPDPRRVELRLGLWPAAIHEREMAMRKPANYRLENFLMFPKCSCPTINTSCSTVKDPECSGSSCTHVRCNECKEVAKTPSDELHNIGTVLGPPGTVWHRVCTRLLN
jgi:hypothetical protein